MTASQTARIAFAGTPDFAVPALAALMAAGHEITAVFTQPDRPAGRGRPLAASPVKRLAAERGVGVRQPERLDQSAAGALPAARPDLLVVVAYGLLLPEWMLAWPRVAPVNLHASLLPRWRGASPIQQAILAGDETTGVSLMRMARGLDTGPVYCSEAMPIGAGETAGELHDRLARLGAALLVAGLPAILDGTLEPAPQDETAVCYAPRIEKRDAVLDWSQPAAVLARRVRAFNPWPVAESRTTAGDRLRIWRAEAVAAAATDTPGTIAATGPGGIDVAAGEGLLRLQTVQPPGGRAMSAAAYLAAHSLAGARFVG